MLQKRWVLRSADQNQVKSLTDELKVQRTLCELMVNRGINEYDVAKKFFRPQLSDLHDPFLMKDMDRAVERINTAIQTNEKVLIYGDYDVDGTTAVATMYSFLIQIYNQVAFYIPDRHKEGYGISQEGIDWANANGITLIIALDCGIKSIEKVAYGKSLGIDFIICDHHLPGETIPEAYAVLDPKRIDCEYPFKELSGCGIGFKLAQGFAQKYDMPIERIEPLLDMVAVSIAADIVDLQDENRTLAYFGLKLLNSNPRFGFKALIDMSSLKGELTISSVVFTLGPRINAAGRIGHGSLAVKLLVAETYEEACTHADALQINNNERRNLDSGITEEALLLLERDPINHERKSTVLFKPDWNKGVLGIVASRLLDKYYRPTIVLTGANGIVNGSARSVMGYDIYAAIESCSELLDQFGGHKYAAGLSLKTENVPFFIEKFERIVSETMIESMLTPEIEIDAEVPLSFINTSNYNILKQFAPFGPKNMKPVFVTMNVVAVGRVGIVGENHLRFSIKDSKGGQIINCIGFGLAEHKELVDSRKPFNLCYCIEENEWNNSVSFQLYIKDIKSIEDTAIVIGEAIN
jgi:single-stranded-DNA-specific exonuclease